MRFSLFLFLTFTNLFQFQNIYEYQQQLLNGECTCKEAVDHFIKKIEDAKHLNAFVAVFSEECRTRAEELDKKRRSGAPIGKLHGVVVAIKDVICYKDHPVTAASKILQGFNSLYDSTAVKKLLQEDAIIIGSCNCDEFAMGSTNENSSYGNVLNALDETKVPGGSSGGSAVAVQAGLCMVSLGSDTGGSVRQPADFCGIVGFKPSYGRISRHGLIAYASSFDQIGIFANNVEDIAITFQVLSGGDEFDSTVLTQPIENIDIRQPNSKKFRVAYFSNALSHSSLDLTIKERVEDLLENLEKAGHEVQGVEFELLDFIVPAYYILTTAEASSNLSRYDGIRFGKGADSNETDLTKFYTAGRSNGFGKEVKRRLMLGTFVLSAGYHDAYFTKAQQIRKLLCERSDAIFRDFDVVIIPTVPVKAFNIGEINDDPIAGYLADIYTVYANLAGIPGISLPLFRHPDGMPFGVQIMSGKYNELTLLQFSNELLEHYKNYSEVSP